MWVIFLKSIREVSYRPSDQCSKSEGDIEFCYTPGKISFWVQPSLRGSNTTGSKSITLTSSSFLERGKQLLEHSFQLHSTYIEKLSHLPNLVSCANLIAIW